MKVILIHNPDAGDGAHPSGDQVLRLIREAGYSVDYQSSKEKNWHGVLREPSDVVAVAGGDGAVGKVARRLVGSGTPIAILPMGTANNVASTLGLTERTLKNLILGWETARRVKFDIGVAEGPWGSERFIEGFGVGLFAETMSRIQDEGLEEFPRSENPEERMISVLNMLKQHLQSYPSRDLTVRLDGQDMSGEYVLLEAMNIRYIGPNLDLVPGANTGDGLLDIVYLSRGEEAKLSRYLSDCIERKGSPANLTVRRCRHVHMKWEGFPVHIDDEAWPERNDSTSPVGTNIIDVKVEPGALEFLTPG